MKKRYSEVVALPEEFEVTETKNGHPQLKIPLRIVDCSQKERIGQTIVHYQIVVLTNDDSPRYAVEALRALGMTNANIFKPEGLGSIKASCTEHYETYDGSQNWKSKYINPLKAKETMTGDSADAFSAALEAAFAQEAPAEVNAVNKAPDELPHATDFPGPPPVDDDDIFA